MASVDMKPALKRQLEAADNAFAKGDLKGARNFADFAKNLFPDYPETHRAFAAYKVHSAAATTSAGRLNGGKPDPYAVLSVTAPPNGVPGRETHDAIKSQHKALCDLLDPSKAGGDSAAVAGAYKLINEAFTALTDIKKSEAPAARPRLTRLPPIMRPKTNTATYRRAPAVAEEQQEIAVQEAPVVADPFFGELEPAAATVDVEKEEVPVYDEEEEDGYNGGGRRRR